MELSIVVEVDDPVPPPAGSPIRAEVRDVSYEDSAAIVLASVDGVVERGQPGVRSIVANLMLALDSAPTMATLWVHVDADRDGHVSPGDFVTMQSYPVPAVAVTTIGVMIKRV